MASYFAAAMTGAMADAMAAYRYVSVSDATICRTSDRSSPDRLARSTLKTEGWRRNSPPLDVSVTR